MPRGHRKITPWVRVPQLKQPGMCGLCGKCGQRHKDELYKYHGLERYCTDTQKTIQRSAPYCAGPFLMEHKVKDAIRRYADEEQTNDQA